MPKNKEIKIGNTDFKLQHPGIGWSLDIDEDFRRGKMKASEFAQTLIENVVVEPANFGLEDFQSVHEVSEFNKKVRDFL
jgi:hypothetical protein